MTSPARVEVQAPPNLAPDAADLIRGIVQGRLPEVIVEVAPPGTVGESASPDVIRVELDTTQTDLWRLRIRRGAQTWARQIAGSAKDAAALEAASIVLARALVALLELPDGTAPETALGEWRADRSVPEADKSEVTRAAHLERPVPPPTRPLAPSQALTVTAHGAYRGQAYAPEIPWASGIHVGATLRHRSGYCAALGATAFVSEVRAEGFGTFGVSRFPVELLGAGYCGVRGHAHLRALVGVTLEPTLRTQALGLAGATGSPPSSFAVWAASGTLAGDWTLTGPLRIAFGAGLDAFLAEQTFVAEGAPASLLSPHRFRFRAELGLAFQVF